MSVDVYVPFAGAPANAGTTTRMERRTTSTAFILLLLYFEKTVHNNTMREREKNTLRTVVG
jgi:hypothetical protein